MAEAVVSRERRARPRRRGALHGIRPLQPSGDDERDRNERRPVVAGPEDVPVPEQLDEPTPRVSPVMPELYVVVAEEPLERRDAQHRLAAGLEELPDRGDRCALVVEVLEDVV